MAMPSASQWVHNEPAISWPAHAREGGLHDKRHDLRGRQHGHRDRCRRTQSEALLADQPGTVPDG
jgi:hypothetical protein